MRLDNLKVLRHCVNDLTRLSQIDREKLEPYQQNIYDLLVELRADGVKGFDSMIEFGFEIKDRKVFEILNNMNDLIGDFNTDLQKSGLKGNGIFNPWVESLGLKRKEVMDNIKSSFKVKGFPLPIIKGKLNSIVAPSHAGKTIYSLGLTFALAREGHKVVYITTEEDIDAAVERTINIDANDVAFENISIYYKSTFNKDSMERLVKKVSEEGYEFLVIDYLKKSMWENYSSDHVVMEEINSSILKAMAELTSKISVFAFVQGNRDAFNDKKLEEVALDSSKVALLIDGGMPVYRSADNLLFINKKGNERSLLVAKSRRNPELLGSSFRYNVDLSSYEVTIGAPVSSGSSSSVTIVDNKKRYSGKGV